MRLLFGAALLGLTMLLAPTGASAQAYPTKPVSLLIAFPPGGPSDVLSRMVGKKLEQILGQPFIMDNRPGAGGNIAAEAAAHAAADGHTILMGNNSILATNAALYKKINFDPEKDFAPISLIGSQANILVVNPNMPVQSMAELIALLRANPGKFNYASSGHGTAAHLAAELFKAEAKVEHHARTLQGRRAGAAGRDRGPRAHDVRHRRLGGAAYQERPGARAGGDDDQAYGGFPGACHHRRARPQRLRRHHLARAGRAGEDAARDVVRLHRATVEALNDAAVRKSLSDLGVDIVGNTPEEFAAYIKAEIPKWTAIVKASGATLD